MTRPRRSEQTRDALIAEGIEQLSEHGYHGTGIKQILDKVKVPKGSFYNYFASKEAFVAEIIAEYSQQGLSQLDSYMLSSTEAPLAKIRAIYSFILHHFAAMGAQRGCLLGGLAAEIGSSSEVCQTAMLSAYQQWRSRLVQLFQAAQAAGEVRNDLSADDMASLFWAAWEGSLLRMKMEGRTDPAEQMLNLLLDKVLKPD
jgi:TetR/AcrR family transcriptional repressor of nem operon